MSSSSSNKSAVFLIAGFTGGIGKAILAKALVPGAKLKKHPIGLIIGIDYFAKPEMREAKEKELNEALNTTSTGNTNAPRRAIVLHWDAASLESSEQLMAAIDAATSVVDACVITTGMGFHGVATELSVAASHKAITRLANVNYTGPCLLASHLVGHQMKTTLQRLGQTPTLSVLSSFSGVIGLPARAAYCGSKFALNGYLESLYADCPYFQLTLLCPTTVATGFRDAWKSGDLGKITTGVNDSSVAALTPDECAAAVWSAVDRETASEGQIAKAQRSNTNNSARPNPKNKYWEGANGTVEYVILKGFGPTIASFMVHATSPKVATYIRNRALTSASKL